MVDLTGFSEFAKNWGLFAALFIFLLVYVLRYMDKVQAKSDLREKEYQKIIHTVCDKMLPLSEDSNTVANVVASDVDTLQQKVNVVDVKMDGMGTKVDQMAGKVEHMAHTVDGMSAKVDTIDKRMAKRVNA